MYIKCKDSLAESVDMAYYDKSAAVALNSSEAVSLDGDETPQSITLSKA